MTGRRSSARALLLVGALVAGMLGVAGPAGAAPNGFVTMSDGTEIAVNVRLPKALQGVCDPWNYAGDACTARYPVIFEMSGYDGGSAQGQTLMGDFFGPSAPLAGDSRTEHEGFKLEEKYVTVYASIRGTGCSSGEFDLFSHRSALDGYELIEWVASQGWSNGNVGLLGHSYSGLTAFLVAATKPPSLRAMSVSGLIDDLYRGIVYPGGVTNYGFPLLWTGGIRNVYDVGGGTAPGLVRPAPDDPDEIRSRCAQNASTHRRTVLNDPIVQGLADTDNDWWRARSLIEVADRIAIPTHITGAYQDEQTGPRGPAHLYESIPTPFKRLVLTNGNHGTNDHPAEIVRDRSAWFDAYLYGDWVPAAYGSNYWPYQATVRSLFEMHAHSIHGAGGSHSNAVKDDYTYPHSDTRWTDWFLAPNGALQRSPVPGAPAGDVYVSGSPRQSWSYQAGPQAGKEISTAQGPDEVTYRSEPLEETVAIAGPMTVSLFVQSTAPDTELFVSVVDEGVDAGSGRTSQTFIQRGMLKASHRAIDSAQSDCVNRFNNAHVPCSSSDALMYRPFRPHTNPQDVTPGETYEYLIEIPPAGHIFRPGHRIVIKVHTPPAVDSYYAYVPKRPAGVNTILRDEAHPSRITVPVVPVYGSLGSEIPCGRQEAVRCVN